MRTLAELEQWTPRGRLLDVGCGRGELLEAARRRGWEAVGVEPAEDAAVEARELFGIELVIADFRPGLVPDGSFDAVVLHHSIEHLPDPVEALAGARLALRPGGVLHIATPNYRTADRILSRKIRLTIFDPPQHRFVFSDRTLRRLVERTGFEVIFCRPQVTSVLNPIATRAVLMEVESRATLHEIQPAPGTRPKTAALRWRLLELVADVTRLILPGSSVRLYAVKRRDH